MAADTVNFLRRRRQKVLKYQQLDKRILQGSIGVAVVSVLITAGVFAYLQFQTQKFSEIQQQQRSTQALVNQQASNEAEYLLYSSRLNILGDLLPGRGSQRRALEFLGELTSSDIAFDRISYDDTRKTIVFRVKAQNVLSVENFVERLRQPDTRSKFSDLTLSDVKRDEDQIYTMEISVQLGEATSG